MNQNSLDVTQAFTPAKPEDEQDPRLIEVSREYLGELESGKQPDRTLYLSKYPELQDAIEECLDGIDLAFTLQANSRQTGAAPTPFDGQPLGDFRIIREIGRGGMGIVYEATQLSLGRPVALKVLPFAASLDERHLQRFRLEAQAAAQLHHNNIVPVYAVGCERGTHYYAMQLINGQPITATLLDSVADGKKSDLPRQTTVAELRETTMDSRMTLQSLGKYRDRYRAIAFLIAQVADALEYAHSCGIVHRDVKPANLLLDSQGKIWVTDFGLAHVAANNSVTQTGDLIGTLRYMSPEQASGQRGVVDHRADVYSLGATLYELLTRSPIFEAQDRHSLLHQILNDDPKPPRQLDSAIPIELETIVLKATQHSPVDRYATAEAFAADLRRFLDERPILAKRPTLLDQTRKWMRRHPSAVVSILVTLVIGVVSLGATTAAVTRQKMLTQASLNREQQRLEQAEKRLDLAQKAADEMFSLAEEELSNNPHEEILRQRLLNSALEYYTAFIEERSGDPEAQAELQQTRDRIQKILADLALVQADRDTQLLLDEDVRKDIQLSDAQVEQLVAFEAKYAKDRAKWSRPGSSRPTNPEAAEDNRPMYEKVLEQAKRNDARLSQILTSNQRKRLRQIALQMQGPIALRDMNIVGELELSKDQKNMIQSLIMEFHSDRKFQEFKKFGGPDFGGGPRGGRGMDRGSRGKPEFDGFRGEGGPPNFGEFGPGMKFESTSTAIEDNAELMEKILAVLTPDQRERWRQLVGEPLQRSAPKSEPIESEATVQP